MDNWILLSFVNWLHIIATVFWIGGMAANMLIFMPAVKETLEPPTAGKLMGAVMRRFRVLAYISMAVLVITGIAITMTFGSYGGFLQASTALNIITLIKHILIAALVIIGIYAFEGLGKKVSRLAAKGPSPELARLQKKQMIIASTGFIFGLIILLLSGMMRVLS